MHVAAHEAWVHVPERAAHVLDEGKVRRPVIGVHIVKEDPANPAHFLAVRQVEIFITPFLVARIVGACVSLARRFHGGMESCRVRIFLGAASVEHRGQIGAAAKPPFGGHHHAGIHMNGGHIRVPGVGDQRNA